jgi:hypothetical protein
MATSPPSGKRHVYYDELVNNEEMRDAVAAIRLDDNTSRFNVAAIVNGILQGTRTNGSQNPDLNCGTYRLSRSEQANMIVANECYPIAQ